MTRRLRATLASAALTSLLATAACSGDEPADSGDEPTVTAELLPAIAQAARARRGGRCQRRRRGPGQPGRGGRDADARAGVGLRLGGGRLGRDDRGRHRRLRRGGRARRVVPRHGGRRQPRARAGPGAGASVFTDEFAGDELDTSTWYPRGEEYNPDGLRACSKGSLDAVDVRGGVLNLRSQLDPARRGETCEAKAADGESLGDYAYRLNGHIANANLFQYGVTAARIKFQPRARPARVVLVPVDHQRRHPRRPRVGGRRDRRRRVLRRQLR